MNSRQSGHIVLIIATIVIAVGVLGLLGWVLYQNFNTSRGSSVTTYEQCKDAPGSVIQETYPERCVTSDGRSFTNTQTTSSTTPLKSYCSEAEKLCFTYPSDWKITQNPTTQIDPGATSDSLTITSPSGDLALLLESGIGGIGGTCDSESAISVKVQAGEPIPTMTGYQDEYSINTLHVASAVYPIDDAYVAAIYVTDEERYTAAGTIQACGLGFSEIINGKNARISAESDQAGAFRFGYNGRNGATFATEKDALDALESDSYLQARAILVSLHY